MNKTCKVFVGNVPFLCSQEEFQKCFEQMTGYIKAEIICSPGTDLSRGFGFVTFDSPENAKLLLGNSVSESSEERLTIDTISPYGNRINESFEERLTIDTISPYGNRINESSEERLTIDIIGPCCNTAGLLEVDSLESTSDTAGLLEVDSKESASDTAGLLEVDSKVSTCNTAGLLEVDSKVSTCNTNVILKNRILRFTEYMANNSIKPHPYCIDTRNQNISINSKIMISKSKNLLIVKYTKSTINFTREKIYEIFSKYGNVGKHFIVSDQETGNHKGSAVIELLDDNIYNYLLEQKSIIIDNNNILELSKWKNQKYSNIRDIREKKITKYDLLNAFVAGRHHGIEETNKNQSKFCIY
jgi:RNA recognition motif-containing protein